MTAPFPKNPRLSIALLVATVALPAFAAESPLKVLSFTAKAKVALANGTKEPTVHYDATYSVRGDMLRVEASDPVNKTTISTIQRNGMIYYWGSGAVTGTKIPAGSEAAESSATFADIARCLQTGGREAGREAVDGVATTKWTYPSCGRQRNAVTVWITKDGAPKKLENRSPEGAMSVVTFTNLEAKNLTEEPFMLPAKMAFITPQTLLPQAPATATSGRPVARPAGTGAQPPMAVPGSQPSR
jgi:hypothetical protein